MTGGFVLLAPLAFSSKKMLSAGLLTTVPPVTTRTPGLCGSKCDTHKQLFAQTNQWNLPPTLNAVSLSLLPHAGLI